jgi:hypothetical protein
MKWEGDTFDICFHGNMRSPGFSPSTEEGDAMRVVHALVRAGYEHVQIFLAGSEWCVGFDKNFFQLEEGAKFEARANTLPHAICLAALKTLEASP